MFVLCHWPLRIIPRFRIVHRLPRRLHLFGHRHPNQMSHRNLFARRCRDLYQLRRRDLRIFGRFDVVHNMPGGVFLYRHWEVIAAADLLEQDFGVLSDVWSVTSFTELRRDGLEAERWNMLHPDKKAAKAARKAAFKARSRG